MLEFSLIWLTQTDHITNLEVYFIILSTRYYEKIILCVLKTCRLSAQLMLISIMSTITLLCCYRFQCCLKLLLRLPSLSRLVAINLFVSRLRKFGNRNSVISDRNSFGTDDNTVTKSASSYSKVERLSCKILSVIWIKFCFLIYFKYELVYRVLFNKNNLSAKVKVFVL